MLCAETRWGNFCMAGLSSEAEADYEKIFLDACKVAQGNGHILGESEFGSVDVDEKTHVPDMFRETHRCTSPGCSAFVEVHRSTGADSALGERGKPLFAYGNAAAKYRCGLKKGELLSSSSSSPKKSYTLH